MQLVHRPALFFNEQNAVSFSYKKCQIHHQIIRGACLPGSAGRLEGLLELGRQAVFRAKCRDAAVPVIMLILIMMMMSSCLGTLFFNFP